MASFYFDKLNAVVTFTDTAHALMPCKRVCGAWELFNVQFCFPPSSGQVSGKHTMGLRKEHTEKKPNITVN